MDKRELLLSSPLCLDKKVKRYARWSIFAAATKEQLLILSQWLPGINNLITLFEMEKPGDLKGSISLESTFCSYIAAAGEYIPVLRKIEEICD